METVTSTSDANQASEEPRAGPPEAEVARPETETPSIDDGLGTDESTSANPPGVAEASLSLFRAIGRALSVLSRPRVAGVLIGGLGVLIILLLGYIYVFTPVSAARSQHTLLQQIQAQPIASYSLAEGKIPTEGRPLAVLEIPSINVDQVVVQGTSVTDLQKGPGHMPTSSLPGQRGNAVIAGRRATYGAPFGSIGSLKRGQTITVVDGLGTFHYRVTSVVYAESGRHDVVTQSADNRLTLVTAGSGYWPSGRLAVVATLQGKPFPKLRATHFPLRCRSSASRGARDRVCSSFCGASSFSWFLLVPCGFSVGGRSRSSWLFWPSQSCFSSLSSPVRVSWVRCPRPSDRYEAIRSLREPRCSSSWLSRPSPCASLPAVSSPNATAGGSGHSSTTSAGVSAVDKPMKVTFGTGSIGQPDPTTTVPNERGNTIPPVLAPGQNIIIIPQAASRRRSKPASPRRLYGPTFQRNHNG